MIILSILWISFRSRTVSFHEYENLNSQHETKALVSDLHSRLNSRTESQLTCTYERFSPDNLEKVIKREKEKIKSFPVSDVEKARLFRFFDQWHQVKRDRKEIIVSQINSHGGNEVYALYELEWLSDIDGYGLVVNILEVEFERGYLGRALDFVYPSGRKSFNGANIREYFNSLKSKSKLLNRLN